MITLINCYFCTLLKINNNAFQLEKSENETKEAKNESKVLRSELESVRNSLNSSNFAIERLSNDRAHVEAELKKIRRNESNLLDQIKLREMSIPPENDR